MPRIGKPGDAKRRNDIKRMAGTRRLDAYAASAGQRSDWTVTLRGTPRDGPPGRVQVHVYRVENVTRSRAVDALDLLRWMQANGLSSGDFEAVSDAGIPTKRGYRRIREPSA